MKNIVVANIRCVLFTFHVVHAMDHGWITHGTVLTPPYMAGMNQFMEFTLAHNNGAEDMLCPCKNCRNGIRGTIEFLRTYTRWIYHRESGDIGASSCTANDDGYESDDSDDFELYHQFVFDTVGALVDDMGRTAGKKEDASGGLDIFLRSSMKKR